VNHRKHDDLSQLSMLELFRIEAETQTGILTAGLLELERSPNAASTFETLMRAAHSIKGAARIVNLQRAVRVAHAMEDCFVAAQHGKLHLSPPDIDLLLRGVDLLAQLGKRTEAEIASWETDQAAPIADFLSALAKLMPPFRDTTGPAAQAPASVEPAAEKPPSLPAPESPRPGLPVAAEKAQPAPAHGKQQDLVESVPAQTVTVRKNESVDRVVRLTAESLNRLLGLAGESLVESRWLRPFADSMQRLKRNHTDLAQKLDNLRQSLGDEQFSERTKTHFHELFNQLGDAQQFLAERMQELDLFDRRSAHLSHRLYLEVLRTRMRPFGDGVRRFPRMVRDLARSLGKEVTLEIVGDNTQVDRDILERLETPLAHLMRNAVDHGCESPAQREKAGKSPECVIRLEARHSAGMLLVTVTDDGGGVPVDEVRRAIVQKKLTAPALAERLSESELLEFLFLPGFTLKDTVTEISGRGVGLDVVQNMVKAVRGSIRLLNQAGRGLRVQLQLPLTLSVLRALLVDIAGEPYAVPLSQINRTLKLSRDHIQALEGRHHFEFNGQQVGLLTAHQVLDTGEPKPLGSELPVVLLGDRTSRYGLVVDRFLGERELVVQPLDPRLGKVTDINAAALMEDGSPVLIIDVDDLLCSIEKLVEAGRLDKVQRAGLDLTVRKPKRILAVDDSLTVRELERKLLVNRGYVADVAVDGMDGWNAVRTGHYDLVITDIDMPRMDGVELATLIKKDPTLKSLPVLIVSYKDREEDRLRGLEAGADYYLTKGSFHDETLLQAVLDLIGEPEA
jgi:two-component system sensor histidine kinase and response regulator WspE